MNKLSSLVLSNSFSIYLLYEIAHDLARGRLPSIGYSINIKD